MKQQIITLISLFSIIYSLSAQTNTQNFQRHALFLNGDWSAVVDDETREDWPIPGITKSSKNLLLTKSIFIPDSLRNRKLVLHLQGVRPTCSIRLNGKFVFNSSPAVNFVTTVLNHEYIKFNTENELNIEIETALDNRSSLPFKHRPLGWNPAKGLLNDVFIEVLPAINLELKSLKYQLDKSFTEAEITVAIGLNKESFEKYPHLLPASGELHISISKEGKILRQANPINVQMDSLNRKIITTSLSLSQVIPWSPESPELYDLEVKFSGAGATIDNIHRKIGFHELKISENKFLLNGKNFTVKGVDYFENFDGMNVEKRSAEIENTIHNLKKLGMNTLRSIGTPLHPELLKKCAENGIFVLEELPIYYANAAQLSNKKISSDVEIGIQTLLRRDNSETAILGWGIGVNIADGSIAAQKFVSSMVDLIRTLDSRPVYLVTRTPKNTPALETVDFLLYDIFEKDHPGYDPAYMPKKPILPIIGYFIKPFLVSEDYAQPQRRWLEAEEIQAEQLETILLELREKKQDFAGNFIHALQDWQGDLATVVIGTENANPSNFPAGLLRNSGDERVSFEMIAAYNNGSRRPNVSTNIVHHDDSTVFTLIGGIVILLFLFYMKRDRRLSTTLRRIFMHPHGFYTDLNENRKVPAFITVIVAIAQSAILSLLIGSTLYSCREILLFDEILNLLIPSPEMKIWMIDLIWHPGWLILTILIFYLASILVLSVLFRILGFFFGRTLPLGQYTTFLFWAATCYLPLALVTPIFYRILLGENGVGLSIAVAAFFILWHMLRIYRGTRVLFVLPPGRAFILFLTILFLIFGSIAFYYNQTQALFGYVDYYWYLLN